MPPIALFHGSQNGDLKILRPQGTRPVFASPDPVLALAFSRPWSDRELEFGWIGKGPWRFREMVPGALKLLEGPGHLYAIVDARSFVPRPLGKGLGPDEWTSTKPAPVVKIATIDNVIAALVTAGVKMIPKRRKR